MIHRFRDRRDPDKALLCEVDTLFHQADDLGELPKVIVLRGSQRVIFEERNDAFGQVPQSLDDKPVQVLPVVVDPTIDRDRSASEKGFQVP